MVRAAAAWALVRYGGLTQREAAPVLGLGTGAAVSQQMRKWQRGLQCEPCWRRIASELERKLADANV
jgi:predicted transcriptional regulator